MNIQKKCRKISSSLIPSQFRKKKNKVEERTARHSRKSDSLPRKISTQTEDSSKLPPLNVDPGNSDEDPFDTPTPAFIKKTSEKEREQTRKNMIELYKTNKELFFLNQLFFSVQFFPFYTNELQEIKQNTKIVEQDLSSKSQDFHVFYAGMLYEHLGRAITLKLPREETLLQPLEYVMEYKGSIEILPPTDLYDYDHISDDVYRFIPQEFTGKKKRGYARLLWNQTMDWEALISNGERNRKKSSNREDNLEENISRLAANHVPARCLTKAIIRAYEDEEDEEVKLWYLSSSEFAKWFVKGFDLQLCVGKDFADVPFIKCIDMNANVAHHHFYKPALNIGFWPDCALSFLDSREEITKLGKAFKWPTDANIQRAVEIGCNLEPLTKFEEKALKGNGLIWKISFSKVENYLLSTLTHSQIRCYLFLLLLIQENCGTTTSLLKELLTNLLFQECEKNCLAWKEEEMGQKILILLHTFYERLQNKRFPSFFMKGKNLLATTQPELLTAQATLNRIKQRPLLYSVKALKRLQNQYKSLDLKKLQIFISEPDTSLISYINPHLQRKVSKQRRVSLQQEPNVNLEGFRLEYLLEMFCKHYIDMARSAISCDNVSQVNMYAQAAYNICIIMSEDYSETAQPLFQEIQYLIQEVENIEGGKPSIHDVLRGYVRKDVNMEELCDTNTHYEFAALQRIQSRTLPPSPAPSPQPSIGAHSRRAVFSIRQDDSSENDSIDSQDCSMYDRSSNKSDPRSGDSKRYRSSNRSNCRSRDSQDYRLPNKCYGKTTDCQQDELFGLSEDALDEDTRSTIETINPLYGHTTDTNSRVSQSSSVLSESTQNRKKEDPRNPDDSTIVHKKMPSESDTHMIPQTMESSNLYLLSTQNKEEESSESNKDLNEEHENVAAIRRSSKSDTPLTESNGVHLQSTINWEEQPSVNLKDSTVVHQNVESLKTADTYITHPSLESDGFYLQPIQNREEEELNNTIDSTVVHQNVESLKTADTYITPPSIESDDFYPKPIQNREEEELNNTIDSTVVHQNVESLKTADTYITPPSIESDGSYLQPIQNREEEEPINTVDLTAVQQNLESRSSTVDTYITPQILETDSVYPQSTQNSEESINSRHSTIVHQNVESRKTSSRVNIHITPRPLVLESINPQNWKEGEPINAGNSTMVSQTTKSRTDSIRPQPMQNRQEEPIIVRDSIIALQTMESRKVTSQVLESDSIRPQPIQNRQEEPIITRDSIIASQTMASRTVTSQVLESESVYPQPTQNGKEKEPFNTEDSTVVHKNVERDRTFQH